MNSGAEGAESIKMVNFFHQVYQMMTFPEPPRRIDSKNPIFIFFANFWVRVTSEARGSVSVGFLGSRQVFCCELARGEAAFDRSTTFLATVMAAAAGDDMASHPLAAALQPAFLQALAAGLALLLGVARQQARGADAARPSQPGAQWQGEGRRTRSRAPPAQLPTLLE